MNFRDAWRDPARVRALATAIDAAATRPWTLMEVCGGQTHAILRYGLDRLLPATVELLHGPGCPVCVTPTEAIDQAIRIAGLPGVLFCSFGDMLRVPGSTGDLFGAKAAGADVRLVYSPLDAVALARAQPARQVVFFAVGFETTAPANAMAAWQARREGLRNFSMLVAQVLVPPALEALLAAPGNRVQAFLAAGHVCTVMGYADYEPIARAHRVPIVVTGFEPVDILEGVLLAVRQLESGRAEVENPYSRSVRRDGNPHARARIAEVFRVVPRRWRGIGALPASGLALNDDYRDFDAERRFGSAAAAVEDTGPCIAGRVLRGDARPTDCPAFGTACTPERPLGVTMVSEEGACTAYWRYRRAKAS